MAEWIARDDALNQTEQENNARIVIDTFRNEGVNDVVIAAMLGNMQAESTINPLRNEIGGGGGFGLIQWTPKDTLINHASNLGSSDHNNGNVQLSVILSEIRGDPSSNNSWYTTEAFISPYYPSGATSDMIGVTGQEFLTNAKNFSVADCTVLFLAGRLRGDYDPDVNHIAFRKEAAQNWYDFIQGYCNFVPRLDESGMLGNPLWYSDNPFWQSGYGLPNCTCYAWGRAFEIMGERPTLSLGNAEEWYGYTQDGYERGQSPKLGAIICYSGGSSRVGHVGVVEQINDDGSIITSNSNYGAEYFILYTLLPPTYSLGSLTFQGFIYLPCGFTPTPPPVPRSKKSIIPLMVCRALFGGW